MTIERVDVKLGPRSYEILIGEALLDNAGAHLRPILKRPWTVVVTDENVDRLQGARLSAGLSASGIAFEKIVLPPGEATKSFAALEALIEKLLAFGVERSDVITAFGGGVIGDLAGFAAAIMLRGCRFAQLPTTLLAQVDSAVGGKTAINAAHGKNLVGAFHQPALVLADIDCLASLPAREMRAGYAEVVKYGALGDEPFFAWLEKRGVDLLAGDIAARRVAVRRACEAKADIVAADEREAGARALLNLGHTFGHALEAATGFGPLLHGEAVSAGMALAFDYSVAAGFCPKDDASRVKAHLRAVGLPAGIADLGRSEGFSADALLSLMMHDKKVESGALTLILARRVGEAFIAKSVDADAVIAFLKTSGAR